MGVTGTFLRVFFTYLTCSFFLSFDVDTFFNSGSGYLCFYSFSNPFLSAFASLLLNTGVGTTFTSSFFSGSGYFLFNVFLTIFASAIFWVLAYSNFFGDSYFGYSLKALDLSTEDLATDLGLSSFTLFCFST